MKTKNFDLCSICGANKNYVNCGCLYELAQSTTKHENKKGFALHFDKTPAFIFVSEDGFNNERIFVNGKEVHGWQSLKLQSELDDATTHEIKFLTFAQKGDK